MNSEINYAIAKNVCMLIFVYCCSDISNQNHKYHKYYSFLGLQYYMGTNVMNIILDLKNLYIKVYCKRDYEIKLDKLVENIDNKTICFSLINNISANNRFYIDYIKQQQTDNQDIIKKINKNNESIETLLKFSKKHNYVLKNFDHKIELLDKLIGTYGNSKQSLKNNVLMPFLNKISTNNDTITISPIFLYGNPGTGKTIFVEKLSEILDTTLIKFSDKEKHGYFDYDKGVEIKEFSQYARGIYESLDMYGHDFIIVFIDEIDKKLFTLNDNKICPNYSFLQNILLNINGNRIIYDKYLRANINIKNILIVCASNLSLKELEKKHEAFIPLTNRLVEIHIDDMTFEIKMSILMEYSKKYLDESNIDIDYIKLLIEKVNDCGVRKLLTIMNKLVNKINSQSLFKNTLWYDDNIKQFKEDLIKEYT